MHEEIILSSGQIIHPGETISDRAMDTGPTNLNTSPSTKLLVSAKVVEEFCEDTRLTIQLIESCIADLSQFTVIEETSELTEADLEKGSIPLLVSIYRTSWRFLGLRFVSKGPHVSGRISARVVVEKPWTKDLQVESRIVYDQTVERLPERQPIRVL